MGTILLEMFDFFIFSKSGTVWICFL